MKKNTLWTRDFTAITLSTILSAIGGEAMNLPISLLVFDETGSTMLSALIMVCGVLPDVLFSMLAAPVIDKGGKKKWIITLDALNMLVYFAMGFYISRHAFHYGLYVLFTLAVGTISVFYRLAYSAWYPNLIPVGMEQKGYAVSNTVYPLITIAMSPAATFLYERISMSHIFWLVGALTAVSILIEAQIHESKSAASAPYSLSTYLADIGMAFSYLKKEKGIRNIYTYMSITNGASDGITLLVQAFYQSSPLLTATMLGFLKSAEMIGRGAGGILQYTRELPVRRRFAFTKAVYTVYNLMDIVLLYSPYPLMLANRFLCGALGISSATIRETAVQSYLPEHMRARINALFNAIIALGDIVFQMLAGVLGQYMSYRLAVTLLSLLGLAAMVLLIVVPAQDNRKVYEAVRE